MSETTRTVLAIDALEWLKQMSPLEGSSFIASLPDISEFQSWTLPQWKEWFTATAGLILSRCPENGVTIFYQTDIKHEGEWVDKGYLVQKAAEAQGHTLIWHKIACRAPAGQATFARPAYSHILCFSQTLKVDVAKSTPDVIPDLGEKTWQRGMGAEACVMIAKFLTEQTSTTTLIHPFCGEGSMLAAANHFGLSAIGIERSSKRAEKARALQLVRSKGEWIFND